MPLERSHLITQERQLSHTAHQTFMLKSEVLSIPGHFDTLLVVFYCVKLVHVHFLYYVPLLLGRLHQLKSQNVITQCIVIILD